MIVLHSVAELDAALGPLRGRQRIAFVPTMGNLHVGHLTLVRAARAQAERVIVSIFVNPLQFGAGEDFDRYPRTLQRDAELLAAEGVDWVFAPEVDVMYPKPASEQTRVLVPGLSDILCGASRPGHFEGVATVVCKLFNLVRPDLALFGQKDYQQLMVIRRMVEDLAMPVQVVGMPTVRESDGLAMSSRNGYLSDQDRAIAPVLYRTLCTVADSLREGRGAAELERTAAAALDDAGLRVDYVSIRRQADLSTPTPDDSALVILVAAWLGGTRLIDNLEVQLTPRRLG